MEDSPPPKQEISRLINVLEALKQASHDLQSHPLPKSYDSFRPLLELETESDTILSEDPNLFSLSQHLSQLKSLVNTLQSSRAHHSFKNFLARRVSTHSITRVAESIESEIQAWIDRESIDNLMGLLQNPSWNEPELIRLLTQFEKRISQGFDRELQDLILKSKIFVLLENIICDSSCLISVREQCAFVVAASISFNKDVFVGQVLMGSLIHALVSMGSWGSIKVLCTLIKLIKSPLVDEIESNGEIPKIISFLDYKDLELKVVSLDCVLEIGYFGRKEAIEAMIKEGLIKKLVELQRLEIGGNLVDMELKFEEEKRERESCRENREKGFLERHPFASCVARFAVQLEVGEGLRQREKRAFKQVILERVREGSVSDAEAATIVAEVLWGSSP